MGFNYVIVKCLVDYQLYALNFRPIEQYVKLCLAQDLSWLVIKANSLSSYATVNINSFFKYTFRVTLVNVEFLLQIE